MNCKGFIFFSGCMAVLLGGGCSHKKITETVTERTKTAVSFVTPEEQDFIDYIKLNGNTQFQKKSVVRANITGYIMVLPWKTGARISSGKLFCTIRTKEQDALKEIDNREPSLREFRAPIKVYSGASGIITSVNYTKGDFVNEGDVLANVTDPSSLVLVVNVPYEYHLSVYPGRSCLVEFPDGKVIAAVIQDEVPFVDSASQTQSYLIRFPGNSKLPENMNLTVRIPLNQKPHAMALPMEAVQSNETQDEFWVMKLANDSLAVKIPVTVGLQNETLIEIKSGVKYNDRIISKGAYGLADSSLVKVETEKK